MEHYVTLFDSMFLPQGLALHASLERHGGAYTLWVLCMDEAAHDTLTRLKLPHLRTLRLSAVETPELKRVKEGRTRGEYCWTITPFAPRFVFEADPAVERVTYLDADLWFRRSPAPIFREFAASGKHVLITDHAYAPEYDRSAGSGQYCVQFVTFRRGASEPVRSWWAQRCLEWCYNRYEDGKFGDQKYLDDWPERFADSVHVLQQADLLLAPWNATRFPYGKAVAWHFHGLRLQGARIVLADGYALPTPVVRNVYAPYVAELRTGIERLKQEGFAVPAAPPGRSGARGLINALAHNLWRLRSRRVVDL
ncbi:MAG TPA: hypothetical protein VFB93_07570 [Burkholderiales bacterium]|nr:hypothetical protein [Burkholderiales bacterium]